jgi:hypothetical protein
MKAAVIGMGKTGRFHAGIIDFDMMLFTKLKTAFRNHRLLRPGIDSKMFGESSREYEVESFREIR